MSSTIVKNVVDEMVIHLRSDATILIEKHTGEIVSSKFINPDDLFNCIKNSTTHVGIESGILPNNTVFYREEQDGTRRIILKIPAGYHDIIYYGTPYASFPLPAMVLGFVIKPDGHISSKKLVMVEEGILRDETEIYSYPFSNVNQYNFEICVGRNLLPEIQELRQLSSLPYFFLSIPNNDDYFNRKYNKKEMDYRELLEYLKNKDPQVYYNEILIKNGRNLNDFIVSLKQ